MQIWVFFPDMPLDEILATALALAQLCLGVGIFTHQHLYSNNLRVHCGSCNVPTIIQHKLIDCSMHEEKRKEKHSG